MGVSKPSKRALSARQNGKLGGLKTASTHSPEYLELRSARAGSATRDKYGLEYYRYLRTLSSDFSRPSPKRKAIKEVVGNLVADTKNISSVQLIKSAVQNLGL